MNTAEFEQLRSLAFPYVRPHTGGTWMKIPCPFHDDASPSASLNWFTGTLICRGECGRIMRFSEVLARLGLGRGPSAATTPSPPPRRPAPTLPPTPRPDLDAIAKRGTADLATTPDFLRALIDRFGISENEIFRRGIGLAPAGDALGRACLEGRPRQRPPMYLIPARSADGSRVLSLVPRFAPSFKKTGPARPRGLCPGALLGLEELRRRPDDPVALLAGERDWLAAIVHLPEYVALSPTTGEALSLRPWRENFRGRRVAIFYDSDGAGRAAARARAEEFSDIASEVRIVDLFPESPHAA